MSMKPDEIIHDWVGDLLGREVKFLADTKRKRKRKGSIVAIAKSRALVKDVDNIVHWIEWENIHAD